MSTPNEAKRAAEEMDRSAMTLEVEGMSEVARGNRWIASLLRDLAEEVEVLRTHIRPEEERKVEAQLRRLREEREEKSEDGR